MSNKKVEEGRTCYVILNYRSRTRVDITPTSLRYRVDDDASGASIVSWTSVNNPTAETVIAITAAQNHMHNSARATEERVVTTEATFADGAIITLEKRYDLINLEFYVPS